VNHYEPARLVSLGVVFTISLVLVFGSVLLSLSVINVALAVDMPDAPATQDTVTARNDGNDDQDEGNDQPDDLPDPDDAPVTTETITPRENEGSKEDDDNSGQSSGNNGNGDNAERATSDVKVTNKPDCPVGQEPGLFTPCMPIQPMQTCEDAAAYNCIPIQSCGNDVAASQPRDLTVTELDNCNEVSDPDSIE
jgi:hypothetical protein